MWLVVVAQEHKVESELHPEEDPAAQISNEQPISGNDSLRRMYSSCLESQQILAHLQACSLDTFPYHDDQYERLPLIAGDYRQADPME